MNKDLLTRLAEERGVKRTGLQVTLSKVKKRLMLNSIEQAACYYIKVHGVDINVSGIIDDRTYQAYRDTQTPKQNASTKTPSISMPKNPVSTPKFQDIQAGPFVDRTILNDAKKNAELYPIIYVFENSVRTVVSKVMEKHFKTEWWDKRVSTQTKKRVSDRQSKEEKHPWHSKRGAAPIYYADITDVLTIIRGNPNEFTEAFGSINRVEVWITEIENTRNVLAHNNPVSTRDKNRLKGYAQDWNDFAKTLVDKF